MKSSTRWNPSNVTFSRSSERSSLYYLELGAQAWDTSVAILGILSSRHKWKEEITSNWHLPSVEHSPKAESNYYCGGNSRPHPHRNALFSSPLLSWWGGITPDRIPTFLVFTTTTSWSKEGCYSLLDSFQIVICPVFVTNIRLPHPSGYDPVFVAAFEMECAWTNDHMRQTSVLMSTLDSRAVVEKMASPQRRKIFTTCSCD